MNIYTLRGINLVVNQVVNYTGFGIVCTNDLQGYVAGGAARDCLYNIPIKDVDVLYPLGSNLSEAEAFYIAETICDNLRRFNYPAYCVFAYQRGDTERGHDFDERLWFCVKTCINGIDVDILGSKYSTIQEVVNHFDCTMNQVYLDPTTGELVGDKVQELVWIKEVPEARTERMIKKFKQVQQAQGL